MPPQELWSLASSGDRQGWISDHIGSEFHYQQAQRRNGFRRTNLHAESRVRHSTINRKTLQSFSGILFHGVQNSFGLIAGRLKGSSRDVTLLRILSYANCNGKLA